MVSFYFTNLSSRRLWWVLCLLDASREADHREEEAVHVEVLKHALNWVSVDPEGDAGHTQIQAAADNIICSQGVCIR